MKNLQDEKKDSDKLFVNAEGCLACFLGFFFLGLYLYERISLIKASNSLFMGLF